MPLYPNRTRAAYHKSVFDSAVTPEENFEPYQPLDFVTGDSRVYGMRNLMNPRECDGLLDRFFGSRPAEDPDIGLRFAGNRAPHKINFFVNPFNNSSSRRAFSHYQDRFLLLKREEVLADAWGPHILFVVYLWTLQWKKSIFLGMSKGKNEKSQKSEVLQGTLDLMVLEVLDGYGIAPPDRANERTGSAIE